MTENIQNFNNAYKAFNEASAQARLRFEDMLDTSETSKKILADAGKQDKIKSTYDSLFTDIESYITSADKLIPTIDSNLKDISVPG